MLTTPDIVCIAQLVPPSPLPRKWLPLMRRQNRMRKLRQSALLLKCTLLRKRLPLTPSEN